MGMSNYLENWVLDQKIIGTGKIVGVQLHTGDPTDAGTANVASIARIDASNLFAAASDGVTSNNADLLSAAAGSDIGNITHITVWDALTGGNCLYIGAVTTVKNLGTGDQYRIPSGSLTITNT